MQEFQPSANVLAAIMRDPFFSDRSRFFTNGVFTDENHVRWVADKLAVDMSNHYGVTSLLLNNCDIAMVFFGMPEMLVISRTQPAADENNTMQYMRLSGNGSIALYTSMSESVANVMANYSRAIADRGTPQDRPLLH